MADTDIVKTDGGEVIPLDFGIGKDLSLDGLTPEQRDEFTFRLQKKKVEMAVDVAERKARLDASVADSRQVVDSATALDGTKADFNITSESQTASGSMKIKVFKVNNLLLYVLVALGILAVVALLVFRR